MDKFNQTQSDFPFIPVVEQIHQQALKQPEKVAVIASGRNTTYRELDLLSNKVANFLREKAAKSQRTIDKDAIIGVLLERNEYVYVAEQGILKAGFAFLPFVTSYPDERINFSLTDSSAVFLITSHAAKESRQLAGAYDIVTLEEIFGREDIWESKSFIDETDASFYSCPEIDIQSEDLAYVIYTSGSTGRPKGVMIEHGNLSNYVERDEKSIEIIHYVKEGRVSLAMAAFSFDVSIVEEFVPLTGGCTVCIAGEAELRDPFALAKTMREANVNGITATPTFILSILNIPECVDALKNVDFYDVGAEAFPPGLYTRLRNLRPDSVIMNVYGPTECTMGCAAAVMDHDGEIVVGGPIVNTKFYVFDKDGRECAAGEKGELIICGAGVGRGYINLPEKTTKAFFTYKGERAYHSGDLASWTEAGTIKIHGRIDNQIKLRGFRIELDEIEKVMGEYPRMKSCAVKVLKNDRSADYLAGYFTAEADIDTADLVSFMKKRLPDYMIPATFMQMEEMPQTDNGKIDRKALPQIVPDKLSNYEAPRNEDESYVSKAFAEILKLPPNEVGIHDDFFELGGDSLSSMILVSKLADRGISSSDIFSFRTVERLASLMNTKKSSESMDDMEERERLRPHKLSPMQVKMTDYQFAKTSSTMFNNMSYLFRFGRQVDPERLLKAVNTAVRNHPALLMTIFFDDDDELVQQYTPDILPEFQLEYMSDLDVIKISDSLIKPFKIFNSPLVHIRLFKSPKYTYFFFDVHHLAMDGSSLSVVMADIVRAYKGEPLPKDYYCTYLAEEEKRRQSPEYQGAIKYFHEMYDGYEWTKIPAPDLDDENYLANLTAEKNQRRLPFDQQDMAEAEERLHASRSVIAIAAAIQALHEFSGKNDIMTNWIFNNRLDSYVTNSVGMLIRNLPVGIHMDKISSQEELLSEVKRQVTDGIAHSTYDYFMASDSAFQNDPMEVNYQLNINADELDEFQCLKLDIANKYVAPGARLELEFLENDDETGLFDSEFEWAGNIFSKERILKFHDKYMQIFISMVLGD